MFGQRQVLLACALWCVSTSAFAAPADDNERFQAEYNRAQQLLVDGKVHDAQKSFEKADKLHGGTCGACRYQMATLEMKSSKYDDALHDLDKALPNLADPRVQARAHNMKGVILMGLAEQKVDRLQKAKAEFVTARQLDLSDATAILNLGIVLLKLKNDDEGVATLKQYLELEPEGLAAQTARRFIDKPRRARDNFAPALSVTTLQGENYSLDAMAGKVVVMDFWATWCPPCVQSVPELKELLKKYPREKLSLISISADEDDAKWKSFIEQKHMQWPHYRDDDGAVAEVFGVHAFPTYLVIDGDGIIRERIEGLNEQQSVASRIAPVVEKILKAPGGVLSKEK